MHEPDWRALANVAMRLEQEAEQKDRAARAPGASADAAYEARAARTAATVARSKAVRALVVVP